MQAQPITTHTQLGSHRDVLQIVASHCCVCRRALTDAHSVQSGIGPICSRKYYSDAHIPTTEQLEEATGSLAASELPDNVIDAVLEHIDRSDARSACNILVYYCSAHYDDRDTVFRVSAIVRDFGYEELADKLEEDRAKVSIRIGDDNGKPILVVGLSTDKWQISRDLTRYAGGRRDGKVGRKYRFVFPLDADTKRRLQIILGYHLKGELALVEQGYFNAKITGIIKIPVRSWHALQSVRQPKKPSTPPAPAARPATGAVRIVDHGGNSKVEFWSPYSQAWLDDMHSRIAYGRGDKRWDGSKWVFNRKALPILKELALKHYGVTL
jgi:hypothetical protein